MLKVVDPKTIFFAYYLRTIPFLVSCLIGLNCSPVAISNFGRVHFGISPGEKNKKRKNGSRFLRRKTASCAKKDGLLTNTGKTKWHQKKQQPFFAHR
jgi:hypothetical protein